MLKNLNIDFPVNTGQKNTKKQKNQDLEILSLLWTGKCKLIFHMLLFLSFLLVSRGVNDFTSVLFKKCKNFKRGTFPIFLEAVV